MNWKQLKWKQTIMKNWIRGNLMNRSTLMNWNTLMK